MTSDYEYLFIITGILDALTKNMSFNFSAMSDMLRSDFKNQCEFRKNKTKKKKKKKTVPCEILH